MNNKNTNENNWFINGDRGELEGEKGEWLFITLSALIPMAVVIGFVGGIRFLIQADIPYVSETIYKVMISMVITVGSIFGLISFFLFIKVLNAIIITGLASPIFISNLMLIKYRSTKINLTLRTDNEISIEKINKMNKEMLILKDANDRAIDRIKSAWIIL